LQGFPGSALQNGHERRIGNLSTTYTSQQNPKPQYSIADIIGFLESRVFSQSDKAEAVCNLKSGNA
jgi:hypothetical protein